MHTAKYPVVHMLNNPSSNLTSRFLQKMPNNFLGRVRVQAPTKPWKKSHQFLRKWSSYHSWILFFLGGLKTLSKTRATISVHKLNHLFQKEKSGNPSRHDFSYWFEHSWPSYARIFQWQDPLQKGEAPSQATMPPKIWQMPGPSNRLGP